MAGETPEAAAETDPAPHYHGHRQRLKERFLKVGGAAMADYELMELLLFQALPRRDVKPLAKSILERFGGFAAAIAAEPAQIRAVPGAGEAVVVALKTVAAAAERLAWLTPAGMTARIHLSLSDEPPLAQAFVVISAEPTGLSGSFRGDG